MAIQYTIREVSADSITVDYSNGSWAKIQIQAGLSRADIENRIREFAGATEPFAAAAAVPFQPGDSGQVLTAIELAEQNRVQEQARKQSYAELRSQLYPAIGDQLDAAYWARNGRAEDQQIIDARIQEIKQALPKDMEPLTLREAVELVNGPGSAPAGDMTMDELIAHLEA